MFENIQRGLNRWGWTGRPARSERPEGFAVAGPEAGDRRVPVPCREGARRIRRIEIVPAAAPLFPEMPVPLSLLEDLAVSLGAFFRAECAISMQVLDARMARNGRRNQYLSTALLEALSAIPCPPGQRMLAVTMLDLYVPILTYVFGEAQLGGPAAVVSLHRLREEFYGLPPNLPRLKERLLKEAVHELGHTCGLRHCTDWECVMSSAHTADRLDLKSAAFCPRCLSSG